MPTLVHYCQFFRIGELGFHKRRVEESILGCDFPLMVEPPLDIGTLRYKNRDGEIVKLSAEQSRRNAFALCVGVTVNSPPSLPPSLPPSPSCTSVTLNDSPLLLNCIILPIGCIALYFHIFPSIQVCQPSHPFPPTLFYPPCNTHHTL